MFKLKVKLLLHKVKVKLPTLCCMFFITKTKNAKSNLNDRKYNLLSDDLE